MFNTFDTDADCANGSSNVLTLNLRLKENDLYLIESVIHVIAMWNDR